MEINAALIVQGAMLAVLSGVGKTVWQTSSSLAKLEARLDAHAEYDDDRFTELRQDVRDIREREAA